MKTGISEIKYSISVVSHNQFDICKRAIKSFIDCIPNIEIIITVNIPEIYDFSWITKVPVVIIQNKTPKGFGANHNQAFSRASGNYFFIVNPDVLITRWSELKLDLDLIYTPSLFELNGKKCDNLRNYPSLINLLKRNLFNFQENNIDWFAGMFLIVHKSLFLKLNGFDERFFMYLEDTDFCLRAKKNGANLKVIEEIIVVHEARRSSKKKLSFFLMHLSSLIKFYVKHPKIIFKIN